MNNFSALLGHPIQHIFFALIAKIFLQPLIEVSFRYQTFIFEFWDPPTNKIKIFTYEVIGIKIG